MKVNDAVAGALILLLSLAVLAIIKDFPLMPGQKVGPALYPGLIASGLLVCAVLLVARGWRARHAGRWIEFAAWARQPRQWLNAVVVIGLTIAFIAWSDRIGFIPTGIGLLIALFLAFRARPMTAIAVAIVATIAIHAVFYNILKVPLPWGILMPVAW